MPNVVALLLVTSLLSVTGKPAALPTVQQFFVGCTKGRGILKVMVSRARSVTVASVGYLEPDGTLVVAQTVSQEAKAETHREWRLREVGPDRFTGTLSTASGPVTGQTYRDGLHLTFRMKGGMIADQQLTLAADGLSVVNVMTVRKFGIVVGRLLENIERCPAVG